MHPNTARIAGTPTIGRTLARLLAALALAAALPATAQPFADGNPVRGKTLHDAKCVSCHRSMHNDRDGTTVYGAFHRKVRTADKLRQRVAFCASQTNAGWFDEDVEDVARYLNERFYKFK